MRRRRRLGTAGSRRAAQACLNGARRPDEHPRLPVTPGELVADGAAAVVAGADALHVHPRDADGAESLAPADVATTLDALRGIVRVPLGMPVGAAQLPDPAERLDVVRRWVMTPDVVSVSMDEEGAADLADALLDRGVGLELGVPTPEAAEVLLASGLAEDAQRIVIAPVERRLSAARATVSAIEELLDGVAPGVPRLLHGGGPTAWGLVAEAGRLGYDCRMGLEDTLRLPNGMVAHDNGELIRAALTVHREAELESDLVPRRPAVAPGARTRPVGPPLATRPR